MPESTGDKGSHTSSETRLLSLGCDTQVDIVSQPHIGVNIPVAKVGVTVLSQFNLQRLHVLQSVPVGLSGLGVDTLETDTREDAGTFGE